MDVGLRERGLNFLGKDLFGEPRWLLRGIPCSPLLPVSTVSCRFFGDGLRGVPSDASGPRDFHKALGCDVNVTLGAVYRPALNCFAASTAETLWFWRFDFRKCGSSRMIAADEGKRPELVETEVAGIAVNKPKGPKLGSGFAAASLDEKSECADSWRKIAIALI